MTYDTVATVSQVTSLLLFVALFAGVLGYTFWPANRDKFDKAARAAIATEKSAKHPKGRT